MARTASAGRRKLLGFGASHCIRTECRGKLANTVRREARRGVRQGSVSGFRRDEGRGMMQQSELGCKDGVEREAGRWQVKTDKNRQKKNRAKWGEGKVKLQTAAGRLPVLESNDVIMGTIRR